jgi:hypothetical protein
MLPVVALVPVLVPLFVVPEFVPVVGFAGVLFKFTPAEALPAAFCMLPPFTLTPVALESRIVDVLTVVSRAGGVGGVGV